MPVTHVHSDSEFRRLLSNPNSNGDKLFLVDYSASWCGPCRGIAPLFEKLSDKYGHSSFQFVHVDVDECADVAGEQRVKALPTFVFYKNNLGAELSRIQGANGPALESKVDELSRNYKPYFGGEGNKLGGASSSSSSSSSGSTKQSSLSNVSSSTLSADEIQSIAQSKIEFSEDEGGVVRVGFRFQPTINHGALAGFKPKLSVSGSEKVSRLREFVDSLLELAGGTNSSYTLHNSYPPGVLDEGKSIADCGVAGAVVVVKFN